VQYRLIVRRAGIDPARRGEGLGMTENLSERGCMLSVDIDPPLQPGDLVKLELELPGAGPITVDALVRWTSSVLPGMAGVEFNQPTAPELLGHLAQLERVPFHPHTA
jgi:hypothetical protein